MTNQDNIDTLKNLKENNSDLISNSFEEIEMIPIAWLWDKRIALGKISMIAGEPGLGKSQISAYLASQVSNGSRWPDTDINAPQGNVIILSAEDDPSDTIKPRLIAIGANLKHCHFIQPAMQGNKKSFCLDEDLERLEKLMNTIGDVRLIIIDPLSAYLGKVDSHRDSDIRAVLSVLSDMASKHNTSIILISHLNKGEKTSPINRIIGSIGAPAASRAVYLVMKDTEKPEIRYILPVKNNIGNDKDGFSYHIEGVDLELGIETSKICFNEELIDAHKILLGTDQNDYKASTVAGDFLLEILKDGAVLKSIIDEQAEGAGISKSAIFRAGKKLHVKIKKLDFKGVWEWSLPDKTEETEDFKF